MDIDDYDVRGDHCQWDDTDDSDGGYESPTPTRSTDVESFHLLSHALTEEGDIHLMFNTSLLLDVAQNQFVHNPRQKKNLQLLIGLNQQALCPWQTTNASSPREFPTLFVDDFTWTRI